MNQTLAQPEVATKLGALRTYLANRGLAAALLSRRDSFAWLTGGKDNHVASGSENGFASLLVTADRQYMVTTTIEAPRIVDEELTGQRWEALVYNWYEPNSIVGLVRNVIGSGRLAADTPFPGAELLDGNYDRLRYSLLPAEIERYRTLGAAVAAAMEQSCREVKPGQTEHEIGALLSAKLLAQGIEPSVLLIAVDERIRRYRHPIPKNATLDRHAMLVVGALKWGLYISITRHVHFGPLPAEIVQKQRALAVIDAAFTLSTRPGERYGDVFRKGVEAYAATGFPTEWTLHHQGGPTGYRAREFIATFETDEPVLNNQAVAWNPSITGTKSEDTIVVSESGFEVLTERASWPMIEAEYQGHTILQPAILQR